MHLVINCCNNILAFQTDTSILYVKFSIILYYPRSAVMMGSGDVEDKKLHMSILGLTTPSQASQNLDEIFDVGAKSKHTQTYKLLHLYNYTCIV